jgi:hypothetical protein
MLAKTRPDLHPESVLGFDSIIPIDRQLGKKHAHSGIKVALLSIPFLTVIPHLKDRDMKSCSH